MLLKAYKDCYATLLDDMKKGEEVDLGNACVQETKNLQSATEKAVKWYKESHGLAVNDRKQGFYNPVIPYFQNL